ncbi:helix-turn-helix domain-containing protein [Allosphingosinicella sp.]|uniref:helix-turn-helix domain-containing protein n=1 Tax=Allosphingosinicella sp. TaxID=2823234 RepID=UPI0037832B18
MTKVSQTSAAACDADTYAIEAAEADFVLSVQCEIQKLMNDKSLRARDLSKRLKVTEARVSQMFGDQATNLTLRTLARVFHHLGETPYITTCEEFERALAEARGELGPERNRWTVNGLIDDLQVAPGVGRGVAEVQFETPVAQGMLGQWIRADQAGVGRPRRLAAVR